MWKVLGSKTFSSAPQNIPLDSLPSVEAGGISRLKALVMDVNITAITSGAGGAITPVDLHNITSQIKVDDGKNVWGPELLNGQTLSEIDFQASGRARPFTDANGDANIALSTGPVARRFRLVWDFSNYGKDGTEYCPACDVLRDGKFSWSYTAPANISGNPTIAWTLYAETFPSAKVYAAPRLTARAQQFPSKQFSVQSSGFLMLWLAESSANVVAADLTNVSLSASGGPVMEQADVLNLRGREYDMNPSVTSALLQQHFSDPVGGTFPRAVPLYPNRPTKGMPVSMFANGKLSTIVVGNPTLANYQSVTVTAEDLDGQQTAHQWAKQGSPEAPHADNTDHATADGNKLGNDRIRPALGRVLVKRGK